MRTEWRQQELFEIFQQLLIMLKIERRTNKMKNQGVGLFLKVKSRDMSTVLECDLGQYQNVQKLLFEQCRKDQGWIQRAVAMLWTSTQPWIFANLVQENMKEFQLYSLLSQDIQLNNQQNSSLMERIFTQPSALDLQFSYMEEEKIVNFSLMTRVITQNVDWNQGSLECNHPCIDFFGQPQYFKRKNYTKKPQETQKITKTEQSQSVSIEEEKYFGEDSTQHHISLNDSQPNDDSDSNERRANKQSPRFGRKIKRQGQAQSERKQYPTKNFLPAFRPSFISYLSSHFQTGYFNSIPIIARINEKRNAINMKDYQDLFCYEAFRPILQRYFEEKEIYRFLMMSRINQKTKHVYIRKIQVFQRAFREKNFAKIN